MESGLKYGNNSIIIPIQCPDINDYDHFTGGIRVALNGHHRPANQPNQHIRDQIFIFGSSSYLCAYVTNIQLCIFPPPSPVLSPAHSLDESWNFQRRQSFAVLVSRVMYIFALKLPISWLCNRNWIMECVLNILSVDGAPLIFILLRRLHIMAH